jgi:hypothetical protein
VPIRFLGCFPLHISGNAIVLEAGMSLSQLADQFIIEPMRVGDPDHLTSPTPSSPPSLAILMRALTAVAGSAVESRGIPLLQGFTLLWLIPLEFHQSLKELLGV